MTLLHNDRKETADSRCFFVFGVFLPDVSRFSVFFRLYR